MAYINGKKVLTIVKHIGTSSGTPIETSTNDEMAAVLTADNVGKIYLYTGETNETYTNGHLYQVVDDENTPVIEDVSEGITIPQVSNIVLNENGTISFDAPNITDLEEYSPVISYIVNVNGRTFTTTENTNINVFNYLVDGTNSISVTVKAVLTMSSDAKTTSASYSRPVTDLYQAAVSLPLKLANVAAVSVDNKTYIFGGCRFENSAFTRVKTIYRLDATTDVLTTLEATTVQVMEGIAAVAVGKVIYLFGGKGDSGSYNVIQKFDTETEKRSLISTNTPTTISFTQAVYINNAIYLFGGVSSDYVDSIYKFDPTTETISTLTTKLPVALNSHVAFGVGNTAYIFGGFNATSGKVNTIYKFDAETETITTLDTKLPTVLSSMAIASINNLAYIFGGDNGSLSSAIYKFDAETETITTLDTKLPYARENQAATNNNNVIYIIGGSDGTTYKNEIYKYVPSV